MEVVLYSRQWKSRVAEVKIVGKSSRSRHVHVKLDLHKDGKIFAAGTLIEPISDDIANTRIQDCRSLLSLQRQFKASAGDNVSPFVKFDWPTHYCRRKQNPIGAPLELLYDADVDEAIESHGVGKQLIV